MSKAIDFFAQQFDRQIDAHDYTLNVFEERVLPYLEGDVLDLGCGLGNLAIAAAQRGHRVTALDACNRAVEDLQQRAADRSLPIDVSWADLADWRATRSYDAVVSIGLLLFVDCPTAHRALDGIKRSVRPGGVCAVNVLIEGTTFMKMFDADHYCLFAPDYLTTSFADWTVVDHRIEDFAAAEPGKIKRFATLIARQPA